MKEKEKEKLELTEEEAKKASEGVEELINYLDNIKTKREKNIEKLKKMAEEYDSLEDGHYKKRSLENKIYLLKNKLFPKIFWPGNKGTYRKEENKK